MQRSAAQHTPQPSQYAFAGSTNAAPDSSCSGSHARYRLDAPAALPACLALQSDHWRPLGWRQGGVTLAGHPGAVATVEATWVPLAAGTLPVPALRLNDVAYQEVFDVGLSGGGAIAVAEAG